jgi:DNA-binding NarL/FixJ family response regulator
VGRAVRDQAARRDTAVAALTDRERQVLSAMAEGRSNTSIAAVLRISEGLVEEHVASIHLGS